MDEPERDTIRLSVPADDAMRPVVEAAVGVLARRCGLGDEAVRAARTASGDALAELSGARGEREGALVRIEIRAMRGQLAVHLSGLHDERSLLLP